MAKIPAFWAALLKNAIALVTGFITVKIEDPLAKAAWLKTLEPTGKIIDALADNVANDKAQIAAIIKQHTNEQLLPFAEGFAQEKINLIKQEMLRVFISTLAQPVFAVGSLSTNSNPDNEKEVLQYTEAWLEDSKTQDVLIDFLLEPLLKKAIQNPLMLSRVLAQVSAALGTINIDLDGDNV
jgi:hypothetical protein